MGTIADKLLYLDGTKTALRDAINRAGGNIAPDTPFRQYAQWITEQSATLSLDFVKQSYIAKTSALVPDRIGFSNIIAFTRPTTEDFLDVAGVVQSAGVNVPRFNYLSAGVFDGLLLDALKSESAVVTPEGWYSSNSGTWVLEGRFTAASPTNAGYIVDGVGQYVFTYGPSGGKVYGSLMKLGDIPNPPTPSNISLNTKGFASLKTVKYYPRELTEVEAIALATGEVVPSVLNLFKNNEQGVWYDPSDLSTLFQDAAGTTPVTAVGQPVGLMLDKSKGLALGPELVTGGDFSNPLNWTVTTGWVVSGGTANFSNPTGSTIFQSSPTVVGTYQIEFDASGPRINGSIAINSPGTDTYTFTTAGHHKAVIRTTQARANISINGIGGANFSVDNLSVKLLPGNHATQPTAGKRPMLSARVNLLTKTEDFADGAWAKAECTVTSGHAAPDGGLTAWKIVESVNSASHTLSLNLPLVSGTGYKQTVWAKAAGRPRIQFYGSGGLSSISATVDLVTGAVVGGSATVEAAGDGWWKISATGASTFTGVNVTWFMPHNGTSANYQGNGVDGIYIWHPDLRLTNGPLFNPTYQRVNTATDYDTVGFAHYLKGDGVDDFMQTGSIDFTGTDKVSVFSGVTKLDNTARNLAELSVDTAANNGTFALTSGSSYTSKSRGAAAANANQTASVAVSGVDTSVITSTHDIAGDVTAIRRNGAAGTSATGDKGTGNFGNYPLYLLSRAGASSFFNGHFYSLIIRGALTTGDDLIKAEAYVNSKTGAY